MPRPLRFGILGCARICRRGMIPGIQQSGVATLTAIASRQPDVARSWAAEFNIPKAISSYEDLVHDPEVDAVYIPLPNELHREWALKAAAAGKHVLCEKPLALDSAEAQVIVEGCHEHGVVLMEAFMWRHHPRVQRAVEMVRGGDLGQLRLVKMDFSFQITPDDWRLDPTRGGGALFDLGCYGINAARLFTGAEPTAISGYGLLGPSGVDMTAGFQLCFASGVTALLDCSFECPDRNRIEVVGTQGAIELPGGVLPDEQGRLVHHTAGGTKEAAVSAAQQYAEQVKIFAESVTRGALVPPAEDGLANMKVLDAVKRHIYANARRT